MKILNRCGGELVHALRNRCIESCAKEEYINALEDIVTRTKISRTLKKVDNKSPNELFIKKDKPREPVKPNTPSNEEAEFNQELTGKMKEKLHDLSLKYKDAFATDKEPLGAIIGHEVDIIVNVEKSYPPLLRIPAYPARLRVREALEVHIEE
ncbi:hypothetical protein O181_031958 [Austropuccinia psidii MF-1]|uniref:Uncharacterized protein n=1 Tax=Austropuccinia psidii MF-1 TaxID=1389203 RepID=A0A9Q3CYI7_9BASI|nr:hypothetical protein [Austropuccinia psidii MF-1]